MPYTVPTTAIYTSASSGLRYRYAEDAVVADVIAYDLGMDGATLPDDAWQPCVPGGADPDDDVNMVFNGRFESALLGTAEWYGEGPGDTLSRETGAPLAGTGSLKVVTALGSGSGVATDIDYIGESYGISAGQTVTLSFVARAAAPLTLQVAIYGDGAWSGGAPAWPLALSTEIAAFSESFVLPSGIDLFNINIWTTEELGAPATFWLDDVKLLRTA